MKMHFIILCVLSSVILVVTNEGPETDSSVPEVESTTLQLDAEMTTSNVEVDTTTSVVNLDTTTNIPEEETTATVADGETTTSTAGDDATTNGAVDENTTPVPDEETTTSTADDDTTTPTADEQTSTSADDTEGTTPSTQGRSMTDDFDDIPYAQKSLPEQRVLVKNPDGTYYMFAQTLDSKGRSIGKKGYHSGKKLIGRRIMDEPEEEQPQPRIKEMDESLGGYQPPKVKKGRSMKDQKMDEMYWAFHSPNQKSKNQKRKDGKGRKFDGQADENREKSIKRGRAVILASPDGIKKATSFVKPTVPITKPTLKVAQITQNIVKFFKTGAMPDKLTLTEWKKTLTDSLSLDRSWVPELTANFKYLTPIIPSKENPVEATDKLRLQVELEDFMYNNVLEHDEITIHPSSSEFPGDIDPELQETLKEKTEHVIEIPFNKGKLSWKNGYSTGLYAPPGSLVVATITENIECKFVAQIGSHTDSLVEKESWVRFPKVVVKKDSEGCVAGIASPFGGLLYLKNIHDLTSGVNLTSITVTVTGVIPTPSFYYDKTSLRVWRDSLKYIKAPWMEIVSPGIVLTIPGNLATTDFDPEVVITLWQQVVRIMAYLIRQPQVQDEPQRIVFDVAVSSGTIHAGNPVVAETSFAAPALNSTNIRFWSGDRIAPWSLFHELGHNFQKPEWTFDGGEEASCNILVMFVINTVGGISIESNIGQLHPDVYRPKVEGLLSKKANLYEVFGTDPDFQLLFFYQLRKLYGWMAFRRTFKKYNDLSAKDKPITNVEKLDQWLIFFSTVVQENLSDFFKSWELPISEEAQDAVKHLPDSGYTIKS